MRCSAHTMPPSDSSPPFMSVVRSSAFTDRPAPFPSGSDEVSRFSCMLFPHVRGVYHYGGLDWCSLIAPANGAFSVSLKDRRPRLGFRSSIPGPRLPLSTLRWLPHDYHRKTRGQDGLLLLSCRTLSFPTTCRFIPALRLSPDLIRRLKLHDLLPKPLPPGGQRRPPPRRPLGSKT